MRPPLPHRTLRWLLLSLIAAALTACGGGSPDSSNGTAAFSPDIKTTVPAPPSSPTLEAGKTLRGTVLASSGPQALSKSAIDGSVSVAEAPLVTGIAGAASAVGNAKCPVQVFRLSYATINPQDPPKATMATAQATAALLVPGAGCARPWALLSHQHGTSIGIQGVGPDGVKSAAAYFGSQGYVVVMPDYHGYTGSSVPYHPYLQAEPSGAVVVDAVRAARNWLHQNGLDGAMGDKLFLAGTSEGGYVTMAAQQAMERYFASEFSITASSPTSGPYQVQATFDLFMNAQDLGDESKTVPGTFIIEGYRQRYGGIYGVTTEAYNLPWASEMGQTPPLLPSPTMSDFGPLFSSCTLPYNLKDTGGPSFPGCSNTPLLNPDFVASYKSSPPIGGGAQLRAHAGDNNLLQNWKPISKTYVCYGSLDDMATPNALAAQSYFQSAGVAALMTLENLETETQPVIAQWMASQTPLHPPGSGYHGKVDAPACTSWSRHTVFDPLR